MREGREEKGGEGRGRRKEKERRGEGGRWEEGGGMMEGGGGRREEGGRGRGEGGGGRRRGDKRGALTYAHGDEEDEVGVHDGDDGGREGHDHVAQRLRRRTRTNTRI